ncbi:hypothetical protein Lal_00035157 [Lupinus albus]|uniref:Uncharacterized protein n=1 Tax=Lupinus albus TaxID=3870 RepID=A0A6A5PKH8_LUPAL|nr:hypothetical protein Lalb_Chr03g0029431 [Lupinus albus]KAF1897452.1 hypothetical protein Lal_00035157 [Lupinus albus]
MKISGLVVASIAAASATAVSVSSHTHVSDQDGATQRGHVGSSSGSTDKFAPRFDGLRFIETLITAHR